MHGPLETLLAFDRQYQRDQQQSLAFLHRRDRRYALDQGLEQQPAPDIQHWLAQLQAMAATPAQPATDPDLRLWRGLTTVFIIIGALLGMVTMSGLLFYDGGQQINVTVILGFILLQLILTLYTAAQGLLGWQPWAPLLRRLQRQRLASPPSPALSPLIGPLMTRTAQAAGLAFALSGLVTLLLSVVFLDLAFGWSTTLETSAASWYQLASIVASPWSGWLPVAAPSLELVTETRFFRLAGAAATTDPARWGAWWPFVAMAWLTWATLPRLLFLIVASLDLRRRCTLALRHHPGYPALLWRLETPAVDTGSDTTDSGQLPPTPTSATLAIPPTPLVVCWAGAAPAPLLALDDDALVRAGGRQSLQADREALATLAARRQPRDRQLLVVTRGWEPPTAELEDFLEDAGSELPELTIVLLPLATEPRQRPGDQQLAQWLRFAERTGHGVRVAATDGERTP